MKRSTASGENAKFAIVEFHGHVNTAMAPSIYSMARFFYQSRRNLFLFSFSSTVSLYKRLTLSFSLYF